MAKEDLRKYRDLLLSDEEFQKKFVAAPEKEKLTTCRAAQDQ